jgi:hypothetical protein
MSVNPQTMQLLLAQRLMQQPQQQAYGGGTAGPQMQAQQTPMSTASQAAQRILLMQALQNGQQPAAQTPQM